jgi:hypothetical protein
MNGRRETVTFGKYGPADLSLARARELCIDARRAIKEGRSPAIEKQRAKRRLMEAKAFGEFGEKWLTAAPMADSTRAVRRSIFERELLPPWRKRYFPRLRRTTCGSIVPQSSNEVHRQSQFTSAISSSRSMRLPSCMAKGRQSG